MLVAIFVCTIGLGLVSTNLVLSAFFYGTLVVWSLLVSVRLVVMNAVRTARSTPPQPQSQLPVSTQIRSDLFVDTVTVGERPFVVKQTVTVEAPHDSDIPLNLPVVGYQNVLPVSDATAKVTMPSPAFHTDADLAYQLEEQAHLARVLLSSDALRHFIASVPDSSSPHDVLASVIELGKQRYPSEDGWVVLNEERMGEVCVQCLASAFPTSAEAPYVPVVIPEGTGSLAEMIAGGNVSAAFALIGHRPMFSLSDAVADFDALYRQRQGEATRVSELLRETATSISDDTLRQVMTALSSALDGMYTDEAEAVKTAIMKAVRVRG